MRALITGSEGFVGKYLRRELENAGYEVIGLSRKAAAGCIRGDLAEYSEAQRIVREADADVIFHLAGQADVGLSWRDPAGTTEANVMNTLRLLDAVRGYKADTRLLVVGSSDEYGILGEAGRLVQEELPLRPVSPYAVSKAAQEALAAAYVRAYSMNISMTRSFNHCGAGQRRGFITADLASGIAAIERAEQDRLPIGNLDSERDYTHVSDVARAYRLLAEKGTAGQVYNVGSGTSHSGHELLHTLIEMARVPVRTELDPTRLRPSDTPVICADNSRLRRETGWAPTVSFRDMLADVLQYWRSNK